MPTFRNTPWPTVAVGASLGYLLYRRFALSVRRRHPGYRYDDRRTAPRAFEVAGGPQTRPYSPGSHDGNR
jgi:hypothetical protein